MLRPTMRLALVAWLVFVNVASVQPKGLRVATRSRTAAAEASASASTKSTLSLKRCSEGALSVYDQLMKDGRSGAEMLAEMRADIQAMADQLSRRPQELVRTGDAVVKPIPFRYVEAELVIKDTVQRLAELANAPTSKRIGNRFLEEGQKLESSLRTMLEGLNEGEIFQHARDSTKCHARKFRERTDDTKELINAGLYTQSVFVKMRNIKAENQAFRSQFQKAYKAAEDKIAAQANECLEADNLNQEVRRVMGDAIGQNNEETADRVKTYLEDAYPDKSWLVLIFDDKLERNGFDYVVSDTFTTVLNQVGKNAAILSIDTRTRFNTKVRDILTEFKVDDNQSAEDVFDALRASIAGVTSINGLNNGLVVMRRDGSLGSAWSEAIDPYLRKSGSLAVLGLFYLPVVQSTDGQSASATKVQIEGRFGGSRRFPAERVEYADADDQNAAAAVDDEETESTTDAGGAASLRAGGLPPSCGKKMVAYMSSWSDALLTEAQASYLTHIIYAFIEMRADGSLAVGSADAAHSQDLEADRKKALQRLEMLGRVKRNTDGLRTLFAVGGWENSQYFSDCVASEEMQANFIRDMKLVMTEYDFDGVDIDWEYPVTGGAVNGTAADRDNYVKFLRRLRKELAGLQKELKRQEPYLVTIASAAGSWVLEVGYDLDNIIDAVDWINVMTYDYYGAWSPSKWGAYTGPVSPLYYGTPKGFSGKMNADYTLKYYTCRTSKPEKILMGLPFYGRYWYHVGDAIDKQDPLWRLAEDANGVQFPNATNYEGGFAGWHDVKNDWLKRPGFEKMFHEKTQTPYLWSASNRTLLAYEDVRSLKAKMAYASSRGIGGVMFWAIDLDDDQMTLLKAIGDDNQLCSHKGATVKYKCNPLRERRWWTFEDDPKKAGMCGRSAPLFNGFYPVCDPDDPGYACCGKWGYCGDGPESCSCPNCVDYGSNPELVLQEPVRPPGSSAGSASSGGSSKKCSWHTLDSDIEPGKPRCGYSAPDKDGLPATCNGDDPTAHCCSPFGYCGTGPQFCSCPDCVDFRKRPDYCYPVKQWWTWDDGADKGGRCGPDAPKIKGQQAICNPDSNTAHCCSKWGNCGSGPGFCDCDGCVDFKKTPDFRW